jgi:hypothetical protein
MIPSESLIWACQPTSLDRQAAIAFCHAAELSEMPAAWIAAGSKELGNFGSPLWRMQVTKAVLACADAWFR